MMGELNPAISIAIGVVAPVKPDRLLDPALRHEVARAVMD